VLRLLALWRHQAPDLRLGLAAPTGKTAGRLDESLAAGKAHLPEGFRDGIPTRAASLHRLLGIGRPDPHGPDHPLPLDALIVDGASMVDQERMARLMAELCPETCLILLGDRRQLPHWRKAWTMTMHRAQGSEFDAVLMALPPPETPVLTRRHHPSQATLHHRRPQSSAGDGPEKAGPAGLRVGRAVGLGRNGRLTPAVARTRCENVI